MKLVRQEDVLAVADDFVFTDEKQKRQYMDFLEYCLNSAPVACDLNAMINTIKNHPNAFRELGWQESCITIRDVVEVIKGGVQK